MDGFDLEIPMDALDSLWAFCPCNVTGKQSLFLEEEFRKRGLRVDVYSADIQPTLMQNRKHRHYRGDYKKAYELLLHEYGKPPVVVLGNPVCHYSTFVCPGNHFKLGELTAKDKERLEEKKEWLKNKFEMLHIPECPVIITENPKGYADKVITRADGGKAYVEVQPYQFLGFAGNFDPLDNHVKATHLFSAGIKDAIDNYPIEAYIVQHGEPVGCVRGWVAKQTDSNARSVVPTGIADAISKCAVDRYIHSLKRTTPKELVRFAFHEDKINSTEALEKHPCNTFIGMYNGEKCYCNLPIGHDTSRNFKRGVTCCEHKDWTTGQTLFSAALPTKKRPSKYRVPIDGLLQSTEVAESLLALASTPHRNLAYTSPPLENTLNEGTQTSHTVPVKPQTSMRMQYGGKSPECKLRCEREHEDSDDDEDDDGASPKPVLAVFVKEQPPESPTQCTSHPVLAKTVKTLIRLVDGVVLPSPKPTSVAKSKARASRSDKIMRRFTRDAIVKKKKMKLASTSYATLGKYIMEATRAEKRIADLLKQF